MADVPLEPGLPFQELDFPAGDLTLRLSVFWVTRFGYFRVNIFDLDNDRVVTNGRCAHLNVNMLRGINGYGSLTIRGERPTLENLGNTARLEWLP